jgi:hypothetical protein
MRKYHAGFGREGARFLPDLRGVAAHSYLSSMYAQSNSPQMVGRLCMRVPDRTKKVLDLIYPDCPSNPYQDAAPSGAQGHGT